MLLAAAKIMRATRLSYSVAKRTPQFNGINLPYIKVRHKLVNFQDRHVGNHQSVE